MQVADGLSELEEPLLRVRNLVYAARMLAGSSEMDSGPSSALDTLADTALDEINEMLEERERLCSLARECQGGSHGQG